MPRADVILLPRPAGVRTCHATYAKRRIMLNAIRYTTVTPDANLDDVANVDIRPSAIFVSLIRPDCQILAQST